jgi:hypothetical protein
MRVLFCTTHGSAQLTHFRAAMMPRLPMQEVGYPGLSVPEARTHFALWCLVKSPLLIGADLRKIGKPFLAILKSAELIAISQDPLGKQGRLIHSEANAIGEHQLLGGSAGASAQDLSVSDEEYAAHVARLREGFGGVTDCEYDGLLTTAHGGGTSAVSAAQKWELGMDGTIRNLGSGTCLAVSASNDTAVVSAPCSTTASAAQQWR